jgi:type VI secretion system protein ImpL
VPSFFKRRIFILLVGFLLVAFFIWYAGPYFSFASWRPLETETARLVAIGLVAAFWIVLRILRALRASRATGKLVTAVMKQVHPEQERPSAEQAKLRERFEEAVAALQKGRRGAANLYDLPWYVFIGAPGSGKTTALMNSGLRFPLEQRLGKGAIRGVGGTRNCDWWFTDEAVFLDTAGRYTTQDSDAASDSEGWKEFLALLTKYRKRRPLNGVVLTISAQDLMTLGEAEREAHVEAAQRRLGELTRELQIQLPVYLMVTKCDMVAGFTDYFDDLTQEARAQVWGVTFPYQQTVTGDAAAGFAREYDALMARLNSRVFARLEDERGARRRASVFAFPQQMAALRDVLAQFVGDVFLPARGDAQVLLRGVYLTSGTQDGTQIDRLLGAIGRRFGVAADAVAPPPGRGKAFFVERLLKNVVIGESGLAGVNRRLETRKALLQIAAYAGTVLVVVLGLVALSLSYASNRDYLRQVANDLGALRRARPPARAASLEAFLPYLNAVRLISDSANRHREDTPLRMRWGLYQGSSLGNAARDAYRRELDGIVLPRFTARVRQHLIDYAAEPEKLYEYLRGYLMLGEPKRLDKKHLQLLADLEWPPPDAARAAAAAASPSGHFRNLLAYSDTLRPMPLDPSLVAQARSSIRQASIPRLVYGQIKSAYRDDSANALRFDTIAVGVERVLRRKSGRRLAEPFPSLYTKKVFLELTGTGMVPLLTRFTEDEWVWGGGGVTLATLPRLSADVTEIYEREYIEAWDSLLRDLTVVPLSTVQQGTEALGIMVAPSSPLRGILKTISDNTLIVASADASAPKTGVGSAIDRLSQGATGAFRDLQRKVTGTSSATPGTLITQNFRELHAFMNGTPARFDTTLEQIRKIRDQLARLGPEVGLQQPLGGLKDPSVTDLVTGLKQESATVPPTVAPLIEEIADNARGSIRGSAGSQLESLYQKVVAECHLRLDGRYPFDDSATDMSLRDFADVFGPGGIYDKFFTDNLESLVEKSGRWSWRDGAVNVSAGMLPQFERADRIRQMFFNAGAKNPEVLFTLRLSKVDDSTSRFVFTIADQSFEARPGSDSQAPAVWPGADRREQASYAFEARTTAPEKRMFSGPWAFLRLVDSVRLPPADGREVSDLSTALRLSTKYHSAQVIIDAPNAGSNPFGDREWRQFACKP